MTPPPTNTHTHTSMWTVGGRGMVLRGEVPKENPGPKGRAFLLEGGGEPA